MRVVGSVKNSTRNTLHREKYEVGYTLVALAIEVEMLLVIESH
jgi:hypothetical protein